MNEVFLFLLNDSRNAKFWHLRVILAKVELISHIISKYCLSWIKKKI